MIVDLLADFGRQQIRGREVRPAQAAVQNSERLGGAFDVPAGPGFCCKQERTVRLGLDHAQYLQKTPRAQLLGDRTIIQPAFLPSPQAADGRVDQHHRVDDDWRDQRKAAQVRKYQADHRGSERDDDDDEEARDRARPVDFAIVGGEIVDPARDRCHRGARTRAGGPI